MPMEVYVLTYSPYDFEGWCEEDALAAPTIWASKEAAQQAVKDDVVQEIGDLNDDVPEGEDKFEVPEIAWTEVVEGNTVCWNTSVEETATFFRITKMEVKS